MTPLIWVGDLLFMTWFFWAILISFPVFCYWSVCNSIEDHWDFNVIPWLLTGLLVAAVLYRYPELRIIAADWRNWAFLAGLYIVAGFLMALYKWIMVLSAFKKSEPQKIIANERKVVELCEPNAAQSQKNHNLCRRLDGKFAWDCNVSIDANGEVSVYPNWKKYPLATWWGYWPFFLLSIPFDIAKEIVENLVKWMRQFWESIAKMFVVKG